MPLTASATATVEATPQQVLELVLDLDRYRQLDPKILRVGSVEGPDADGRGSVKLWGRLKGMPPAPDRQDFELVRWSSLTFTGAPGQPARLIFDFRGTVACEPDEGSTVVTHSYEFGFKGPFRPAERLLADWLQAQIEDEVAQLAAAFSRPTGESSPP